LLLQPIENTTNENSTMIIGNLWDIVVVK